jgi:eukaryotic-like serine/threonine-protein kinase
MNPAAALHQARATARGCVDDSTLAALFEGRLAQSTVDEIDAHAASCETCRELLAVGARLANGSGMAPKGPGPSLILSSGSAAKRVGAVLKDKWKIEALIGAGGMAEVFTATHRNGKKVAIKILLPQLAVAPEIARRFVREGYIANQVGHPGVVPVHDDDVTDDGAPFLVMDLLEGEALNEKLVRGRLAVSEAVRIADALLDVLEAAHQKGILHRDIKPGNVFVTTQGEVKLLDFGIARAPNPDTAHGTQTGAMMGTPAYMPPEQARGRTREVDARSDVWAAGATLFSMLTATPVREAATPNELLVAAITQPVGSIREIAPWIHADLAAIVDQALAFEQERRFPSASAMQAALRRLSESALVDPGPSATIIERPLFAASTIRSVDPRPAPAATAYAVPPSTPPPSAVILQRRGASLSDSRSIPWIVGGVVLSLLVVLVVLVAISSRSSTPARSATADGTATTSTASSPLTPSATSVVPKTTGEPSSAASSANAPSPSPSASASPRKTATPRSTATSKPGDKGDPFDRRL